MRLPPGLEQQFDAAVFAQVKTSLDSVLAALG
jgi:hypothetical protein